MRKVEFSRCVAWDVLAHQFHSPSAKDGSFAWSATMNHQTTFRASPAFTSVHEDIYFSRIPTLLCTYLLMSQVGVMCENWIGRNKMLLTHSHALYFADKSFSLFTRVSQFFQHLDLWSQPTVHCAKKFCFQWCHGCHVSLKLRVLTRLICVYPIISFHRVPNKHFFTFIWNRPTTCCFMLESFIRNGLCL